MRHLDILRLLAAASLALSLAACGEPSRNPVPPEDSGAARPADAGAPSPDAAQPLETPDAGGDPAGADAGLPLPGFGAISGTCGVLDTELTDTGPAYFESHLDFGTDPYDAADLTRLSGGGQEMIGDGNAGGSSVLSEVFAFELLHRCELAALLKTEMEVVYVNPAGKLTDILVEIDGLKIGVSVTRAVSYPRDAVYTVAQAQTLIEKKLQGVLDSTANVTPADRWTKQILYVLAQTQAHADAVNAALQQISPTLKADTIVIVTVSDGDDEFIYSGG